MSNNASYMKHGKEYMWSISLNFISGFMVGIEFVTREQSGGTAAFIMDLGIVRFGLYHDHEFE